MTEIEPLEGWTRGEYRLFASSATAMKEWGKLVERVPDDAKGCYERLSSAPLEPWGTRQFPLRGKANKPFWEFELNGGDHLYYAVDPDKRVIVVACGAHPANKTGAVTEIIEARRRASGL